MSVAALYCSGGRGQCCPHTWLSSSSQLLGHPPMEGLPNWKQWASVESPVGGCVDNLITTQHKWTQIPLENKTLNKENSSKGYTR